MKKSTLATHLLGAWLMATMAASALAADDAAVGDAAAGAAKAAVCGACHGADGKALQPNYPNLAGQHASYLAKQLTEYRDGGRVNALMSGQATNLSDQDILDLAAYYADMAPIPGLAAEDNLVLGENIYRGGITAAGVPSCNGCHGPGGLGNPAIVYPSVSGQNTAYSADQLRYFRSAERANDPNGVMRGIAKRLTDEEIEAVSNYMAGLYPSDAISNAR